MRFQRVAKTNKTRSAQLENQRLPVLKTYKMFIGGAFPRTESGRYYAPKVKGQSLGNFCLASRKDLRNSVVAARSAQPGWAARSGYNRSQILYRIAEMLEGRHGQMVDELRLQGATNRQAISEVNLSIERAVYYAGWCDKFQQVFSSVNPVASQHFNFSLLEPTGVVFHVASENQPLLGLVSLVLPIIASGNTVVCLASENKPMSAISLTEAIATSDVPAGVVNVLTGHLDELSAHFSSHLDINSIDLNRFNSKQGNRTVRSIREQAVENLKRVKEYDQNWTPTNRQNPYLIADFCEVKTTWHPIETIGATGSSY